MKALSSLITIPIGREKSGMVRLLLIALCKRVLCSVFCGGALCRHKTRMQSAYDVGHVGLVAKVAKLGALAMLEDPYAKGFNPHPCG